MTNIAERRSLESVDADPHSNVPGLSAEWRDGAGAKKKVEQPREDGGIYAGRGVTSHAARKLSAPMSFYFCGWEAFFLFFFFSL